MDFTFTEEQEMMAEVARALLAETCASAAFRALIDRGETFDPARWARLVELGLAGVLVPEAAGGLGLAEADFVRIATACGYHLLPEPLTDAAGVVAPLLAATGQEAVLAEMLSGAGLTVWADAGLVVAADRAAHLLLTAPDGGLHLLPAGAAEPTRQAHVDPLLGLFSVTAPLSAETLIADPGTAAPLLAAARDRGALWAAAEMLGVAQRAIDMAVAYAGERKQFGKPIGSYQAIKHHLASAQVKVEFARPVVHAAAAGLPGGGVFAAARVSHALLAAGEAVDFAARTALQVHGAMGYSWEVDVHFCLKRALWLTHARGGPAEHRERVAARAFGLPLGPDHLFPEEAHA
ncbi:MAG: acyl-CoA dehydrogenase [Rhodovulum sulfidophilum]|uniref:Acyl-CoA dehydrogenase n=1 Tax=Rhodovulum sulfidophilum TaxID=35806 RepID=A0A2W5MYV0_RHOSU|nr:MAG: acyl-CoA dehydrogenase [Rhodovulum sulfidophilum]